MHKGFALCRRQQRDCAVHLSEGGHHHRAGGGAGGRQSHRGPHRSGVWRAAPSPAASGLQNGLLLCSRGADSQESDCGVSAESEWHHRHGGHVVRVANPDLGRLWTTRSDFGFFFFYIFRQVTAWTTRRLWRRQRSASLWAAAQQWPSRRLRWSWLTTTSPPSWQQLKKAEPSTTTWSSSSDTWSLQTLERWSG